MSVLKEIYHYSSRVGVDFKNNLKPAEIAISKMSYTKSYQIQDFKGCPTSRHFFI